MAKKHNFGAGPCILPQEVFEQSAKAVLDFNGLSILEVSHRSQDFIDVMEEARENIKKALNVPAEHGVSCDAPASEKRPAAVWMHAAGVDCPVSGL